MAKNKETNKKNQQAQQTQQQDLMNKAGGSTSNSQTHSGAKDHCGGSNSVKDCGNGHHSHQ